MEKFKNVYSFKKKAENNHFNGIFVQKLNMREKRYKIKKGTINKKKEQPEGSCS